MSWTRTTTTKMSIHFASDTNRLVGGETISFDHPMIPDEYGSWTTFVSEYGGALWSPDADRGTTEFTTSSGRFDWTMGRVRSRIPKSSRRNPLAGASLSSTPSRKRRSRTIQVQSTTALLDCPPEVRTANLGVDKWTLDCPFSTSTTDGGSVIARRTVSPSLAGVDRIR